MYNKVPQGPVKNISAKPKKGWVSKSNSSRLINPKERLLFFIFNATG